MRNGILLIGEEHTKRTDFFLKAAKKLGVTVEFCPIASCDERRLAGAIVKLDPPVYQTSRIGELEGLLDAYSDFLHSLCRNAAAEFLNHPKAIELALDKRACKELLMRHLVPTTQMLASDIRHSEQLKEWMAKKGVNSVFIKPTRGSGAAGIAAYRFHPGRNQQALYTSSRLDKTELVNTKVLSCIRDSAQVEAMLQKLLSLDTIVERWYPKELYQGKAYDLRVLYQFGRIDFMVARQSVGPITNLHLNNRPLPVEQLRLSEKMYDEISGLCQRAAALLPGLNVAGFDILLERNTKKPYIIELNGQGDLLYQDIFHENRIYRHQIEYMNRRKEAKEKNGSTGANSGSSCGKREEAERN